MISAYLLLDLCPCPSPFPFPCLCLCLFLPPVQPPAPPPVRPPCPPSPSVSLPPPSPATETGVGVARACGAAPLGDGMGQKCSPGVLRYTIGRRIVAEMFPERAARHRWATDSGRSVSRACGAAPLGYGNGRKCSPSVR